MYCGNCLRDNALVRALQERGHRVTMLPVYLPLTLDEPDQSAAYPVFFGGINVYLEQQWPAYRHAPGFLRHVLSSRSLLKLAAGHAAKTQPSEVGELTVSMLEGEKGRQLRELEEMVEWLRQHEKPEVIILSNALLIGMARGLKKALGSKIMVQLAGEDSFLDGLREPHRQRCWELVAERAAEVDYLVAPTHYFAGLMSRRLGLPLARIHVVPTGISLEGYHSAPDFTGAGNEVPVLGFFTRMSREKGLHHLVHAFIRLRQKGTSPAPRLKVGGSCSPNDEPLVQELKAELSKAGLADEVTWHPNLDREEKVAFLKSLTVFSVPALYGEAFGLYVVEAMAAGVPVVQPETASFPELLERTGGGMLCKAGDLDALAGKIEELMLNPGRAKALGQAGRNAVFEHLSAAAMAAGIEGVLQAGSR